MKILKNIYLKYRGILERIVFPVILLLYPLIKINQGVDVSDSTYSLGNYLFFDRLEGMWVISTYLSNVLGSLLVHLPGGNSLLMMNLYTGLIVSLLALIIYFGLKKTLGACYVFAGEIFAISFCWIPTGILYNYMTYLFFCAGALCIYQGFCQKKDILFLTAGLLLGGSVMVRFPNLTQAMLILSVWFGCYLYQEKKWLQKTGLCILGYLLGMLIPLIAISIQYGLNAYPAMITSLMGIQNSDETYSAFSMVLSVVNAYIRSFRYIIVIGAVLLGGLVLFSVLKKHYEIVKKILYAAVLVLMLRFFWGRGMFSFRYYEDYSSMYEWGMVLLYLTWICGIICLFSKKMTNEQRLLASIVLIMVVITPIGSNNYTLQNLNNLFVAAPFTIYCLIFWGRQRSFAWQGMIALLLLMITIQSIGFHADFVFRDGMRGEKRDTKITGIESLNGIYTNADNAKSLSGLISYSVEHKLKEQKAVFYGDAPGLSYLMEIPSAISTSWPDLDSYSMESFHADLQKVNDNTVFIIKQEAPKTFLAAKKLGVLQQAITAGDFTVTYQNEDYTVYAKNMERQTEK